MLDKCESWLSFHEQVVKMVGDDHMWRGHALRIVVGLMMPGLLLAGSACAATLTVNASGGADFIGIQDAINNANPGDTILVYNGTYYENVDINKVLFLIGIGSPVVISLVGGGAFTLSAGNSTINGFTVNSNPWYYGSSGIIVTSNNNIIEGNNASNNRNGIILYSSSNNTITGNTANLTIDCGICLSYSNDNNIIGNNFTQSNNPFSYTESGISVLISYNRYGIYLYSSSNNIITGNNASDQKNGIYLYSSSDNILIGNNASSNKDYGIVIYSSNNNKVERNNVTNNFHGIYVPSSSSNLIENNKVSNNYGTGIFLEYSNGNTISSNDILNNNGSGLFAPSSSNNLIENNNINYNLLYGIHLFLSDPLYSSTTNILMGNNVSNNEAGIVIGTSSNNNTIYHNNILNNTNQSFDSGTNSWDFGYPSGGNYWSDYTGTDSNNDGIGDTSYSIPGGSSVDRYPFTEENGWLREMRVTNNVCAVMCHNYYKTIDKSVDFYPNTLTSFDRYETFLGFLNQMIGTQMNVTDPAIDFYYNTSELYGGKYDYFRKVQPSVLENGHAVFEFEDMKLSKSNGTFGLNNGERNDTTGFSVKRQVENNGIVTKSGYYNVTVSGVLYENVDGFIALNAHLWNSSEYNSWLVNWSTTVQPDGNATDQNGVNVNFNAGNQTLPKEYNLTVTFYVDKIIPANITLKPWVSVNTRKNLQTIENIHEQNIIINGSLFDMNSTFSSSNANLTWFGQEGYEKHIDLEGGMTGILDPYAQFSFNKNFVVTTNNDSLNSGMYSSNIWYSMDINNQDDDSNTLLGDLKFSARADNITDIAWPEYTSSNKTSVNWTYPSNYFIEENNGFSTGFATNHSEIGLSNARVNRWMNQTVFNNSGYQLVKFNVTFENTDFIWVWGRIEAYDRNEVETSIVKGTFVTDAPGSFDEQVNNIHFNFDKNLILPGVTYNFSVVVRVNLTGTEAPPILYKPKVSIGMGMYYNSTFFGQGYEVEMSEEMLPDNVSYASASTNVFNAWLLQRNDQVIAELQEISETTGPQAEFSFNKNLLVSTENDSLRSGIQEHNFGYNLNINNQEDESGTVLGNISFDVKADNITWVGWEQYATWNSTSATWMFPASYIIQENQGFGVDFNTNNTESRDLNVSINRWMNQTEFNIDGYQLAKFNLTFNDSNFKWAAAHIELYGRNEVNPIIVPGTFSFNARGTFNEWDQRIDFYFDKEAIQPGIPYNFSVVIKVNLTGNQAPPIIFKPGFSVDMTTYHNSTFSQGYTTDIPSEMLPEHVSASVSTNVSNAWILDVYDNSMARLDEVSGTSGPQSEFSFTKNFAVTTENDSLTSGIQEHSLGYILNINNQEDESHTVLGDIRFDVKAENITRVGWEQYATWNSTSATWIFPSSYIIQENQGFGVDFNTNYVSRNLLVNISRWMNQTEFTESGYQLSKFNVTFENLNFESVSARIISDDRYEVDASIVKGTFTTDAPGNPYDWDHGVQFDFDKNLIIPGMTYNFSVIVRVNLTGKEAPPIRFKPQFTIDIARRTNISFSQGYQVEIPADMLPKNVSYASASTNISNAWMIRKQDHFLADLSEVSELAGPHAGFSLNKNLIASTENDSLISGIQEHNLGYYMDINNRDDKSDTILGSLNFSVQVDNINITRVGWEQYATWNATSAIWIFPSSYVIPENQNFGVDFSTNYSESKDLNVSINRWMNQTEFSTDGYQLANFNVTFKDRNFEWASARIDAYENYAVYSSIVPGTFSYGAPGNPNEWEHGVNFNFNQDAIQPGTTYNFSVVIKVDLTGNEAPPILFKPGFSVDMNLDHNSTVSEGYIAEIPVEIIPDHVRTSVSTNVSNGWVLGRYDHVIAQLNEISAYEGDITPPIVTNPSANQSDIPDDTDNIPLWGETAQLNVTVTDASGIASVTVNLSEIGGPEAKPMTNIGGNIYSTTTNASAGTPVKVYNLTVNAFDNFGNSNTSVKIPLIVSKNGDCTGNGLVNIGDALRLANNVSYPGNINYKLHSIYQCEVTGNGLINIGDALRLANNVSYPGNPAYILK